MGPITQYNGPKIYLHSVMSLKLSPYCAVKIRIMPMAMMMRSGSQFVLAREHILTALAVLKQCYWHRLVFIKVQPDKVIEIWIKWSMRPSSHNIIGKSKTWKCYKVYGLKWPELYFLWWPSASIWGPFLDALASLVSTLVSESLGQQSFKLPHFQSLQVCCCCSCSCCRCCCCCCCCWENLNLTLTKTVITVIITSIIIIIWSRKQMWLPAPSPSVSVILSCQAGTQQCSNIYC